MILIADSGSTKTDWALIDLSNDIIQSCETSGMNPYSGYDSKSINDKLVENFGNLTLQVSQLQFYGSGCTNETSISMVNADLAAWFPSAHVVVSEDLLGAALAVSDMVPSYVCILGTGSIASFFDSEKISAKSKSLGYLINNEGSGYDIGKRVIKHIVNGKLPDTVLSDYREMPTDRDRILTHIYETENPSKTIAKYAKPLEKWQDLDVVRKIITSSIEDFILWQLEPILIEKKYPVHFIGSIAFHFKDILNEVLSNHGIQMGNVEKKSIHKLIAFHQSKINE